MSAARDRGPRRPTPVAQVRATVRASAGASVADRVPDGYQRIGRVVVVRLPEALRPAFPLIGEAYRSALGVESVLRHAGPVSGELRGPALEPISGGSTETTVLEHGIRFRFDAREVLFARGNKSERHRFGHLVRRGETVVDLFAGIGYFTLPALVEGGAGTVHAVEKNPVSFGYLVENLALNRVADRARPHLGDNREVALPIGGADRAVLGYLPSALPFVPTALPLLRPDGGWLHVHLIVGTREGPEGAGRRARSAVVAEGGSVEELEAHEVKPYGPGRLHAVVDFRVVPAAAERR
ncbi:MAG TPA: class I SAM-dependent methyltransferase family protein [Thermoplasmata archaeon]|nr:class I SAM-dependent methyltransferase family protein [Thermoplasmata archaeon]